MGGVSSWFPESRTLSGVPTSTGRGVRISIKYILSPHYEKRYPPLSKVPLLTVEIEIHPLGGGATSLPAPLPKKDTKNHKLILFS